MRLRSTIPAVTATALLAAVLSVPGQALADTTPSPSASDTTSATPSDTSSASASPSDTGTPSASPSDTSLPTPSGSPSGSASATPAPAPVVSKVASVDLPTGRVLQVTASSAAGLDHLTASFTESGSSTTSSVSGFTLISGTANDGVWQSGVIQLPGYATYSDSVQAFDTAQTASTAVTGTMDYYQRPVFDQSTTITPTTLGYGSETVTATGKLVTWDPASGLHTDQPYHAGTYNEPVYLLDQHNNGVAFGWDLGGSDGSFTVSYKPNPGTFTSQVITLEAVDPHGNVAGPSASVNEGGLTQTRFVLDKSSTTTVAYADIVVSGTLQYLDPATRTWQPAANEPYLYGPGTYWNSGQQTDANGRFSFHVQTNQVGSWKVAADTGNYYWDKWLGASVGTFAVTAVTQQVSLSLASPSINEYSDLTFYYSANSTNNKLPYNRIYVLESPNGRTGWKNLGYIPVNSSAYYQSITAWVDNPHGYWELWSPASPGYAGAVSNVIHTFRYLTAVTGGKPQTTKAHRGQSLHFAGGLWEQGMGNWFHVGSGWRVYLFFKPTGGKWQYTGATTVTNRNGNWSLSARARTSGTWEVAWFTPDTGHVDAFGPGTFVHVR